MFMADSERVLDLEAALHERWRRLWTRVRCSFI